MKAKELFKKMNQCELDKFAETDIQKITSDSRDVTQNTLFVAVRGINVDGHKYIDNAITKGAKIIVCEECPVTTYPDILFVKVLDTREAIGILAHTFYGCPTEKLELIGVTGTNGKTTIATLLYDLFRYFGYKVGLISTVCNYIDGEAIPTEQTTPDPLTLNQLLGRMADEGCKYAFMEVSSHAADQKRIAGATFAGGIFTNLTRDHMDYHGSVENYLKAKKSFFDTLPKGAFALTNIDDKHGEVMTQNSKATIKRYSLRSPSDFKAKIIESHFEGMILEINGKEVATQFIGRFNASNLLAVYGTACLLGKQPQEVLVGISTLHSVAGRFDSLRSPNGFTAIIDYAHTPDALVNVLEAIHEVLEGQGEIITVVGAGGNRDKGKRPLMAKVAADLSDKIIITSDNPRFEEPQTIVNDMLAGLDKKEMEKTLSIVGRQEAIEKACSMAKPRDVILIAGKGHENYQDVKGVKHHFDDKEIVKDLFKKMI